MDNLFENLQLDPGQSINISTNTPWSSFPTHWHDLMEIIMPLDNTYKATINNQEFFLKQNDILLIFPGELHSFTAKDRFTSFVVQFPYSLLTNITNFNEHIYIFNQIRVIRAEDNTIKHLSSAEILKQMGKINQSHTHFKELRLYEQLLKFFVEIGELCIKDPNVYIPTNNFRHTQYIRSFTEICSYISNNCNTHISVDEMAKLANLSRYYFLVLFKEFTGETFHTFVVSQRIKKAEALLANHQMSITEVAYQSGFNSLSTFNRIFQKLHRCSPSEYKALFHSVGHLQQKTQI